MTASQVTDSGPIEVFISAASNDAEYRDDLVRHLALLEQEGAISLWHDGLVPAGEERVRTIRARLRCSRVVLVLVSSHLDPDVAELVSVRRLGARVVPIPVRPFDWRHGPLGELQPLPRDGEPVSTHPRGVDAAWLEVARGVRDVVNEERERPVAPSPPERFRGVAELDAAWRAGWSNANEAWENEVEKIVSRQREFLCRLEETRRKRRHWELILLVGFSAFWLVVGVWLWWSGDTPWTHLLFVGVMLAAGVVEAVRNRRKRAAAGL